MAGVSSRVVINQRVIDKLSREAITALEMTAEALRKEVVQAQVIPRQKGILQGEALFRDESQSNTGTVSLVHHTPYARRLYFHPEYNFHTEPWEKIVEHRDGTIETIKGDGNPNAKGYWFEDWQEGGDKADFVPKAYAAFYRRLTGL